MKHGKSFIDTSTHIVRKEGHRIPVVVSTSLLKDSDGRVLGGVETFRDMSLVEELRKELEGRFQIGNIISRNPAMHKSTLLREIKVLGIDLPDVAGCRHQGQEH